MNKEKNILKNPSFQAILTSLVCIVLGLLIGYIVLLLINPAGAGEAIKTIILNFLTRSSSAARAKALGNTLAKTAPLLMCALSICFCMHGTLCCTRMASAMVHLPHSGWCCRRRHRSYFWSSQSIQKCK